MQQKCNSTEEDTENSEPCKTREADGKFAKGVSANPKGRPRRMNSIAEVQRAYLFSEHDEKSERRMHLYRVAQEILEKFVLDNTCLEDVRYDRYLTQIREAMIAYDKNGVFAEHFPHRIVALVKSQFAAAMKGNSALHRQIQSYIDGMPIQRVELARYDAESMDALKLVWNLSDKEDEQKTIGR